MLSSRHFGELTKFRGFVAELRELTERDSRAPNLKDTGANGWVSGLRVDTGTSANSRRRARGDAGVSLGGPFAAVVGQSFES